nr:hypothetical protein [Ferroplasma sp. Type II]
MGQSTFAPDPNFVTRLSINPCIPFTGDDIQYKLEEINNILGKKYVLEHPKKERDWRTYEQEFAQRRDDRIDNALFCTGVWYNLFNMGRL